MDLILLNLHAEPKHEQVTGDGDPPVEETGGSFAGAVTGQVLEIFNPFEALEDPRSLVIVLVFFGVLILTAIFLNALWSAMQEALTSGGPPQGFALR